MWKNTKCRKLHNLPKDRYSLLFSSLQIAENHCPLLLVAEASYRCCPTTISPQLIVVSFWLLLWVCCFACVFVGLNASGVFSVKNTIHKKIPADSIASTSCWRPLSIVLLPLLLIYHGVNYCWLQQLPIDTRCCCRCRLQLLELLMIATFAINDCWGWYWRWVGERRRKKQLQIADRCLLLLPLHIAAVANHLCCWWLVPIFSQSGGLLSWTFFISSVGRRPLRLSNIPRIGMDFMITTTIASVWATTSRSTGASRSWFVFFRVCIPVAFNLCQNFRWNKRMEHLARSFLRLSCLLQQAFGENISS